MNWMILIAVCCAIGLVASAGEPQFAGGKHRVLFEFVSQGAEQMEAVLNNVENAMKALGPNTEMMLIAHGPGLALLLNTNKAGAKRIGSLMDKGVVFAACENTMKKKNVSKNDLSQGVTVVDSGVAEVVRRQEAGWSYVKSGY
ncbi:MAG TPA: DsrE family protein [Clostridia bacterium]|nr:DsrE family protein [Clostridia bacterium]